jgi:hypothetical protein
MQAYELKDAAIKYFLKKRYAINAEVGLTKWGRFRADLLALSMRSEVVIVETKSSVADFRSDAKWHNYLTYSNRLYFCLNKPTYDKVKDKIPKGVGIMVVRKFQHKKTSRMRYELKVVQPAKFREIGPDIKLNLIIRLAFRNAEFNRYKRR